MPTVIDRHDPRIRAAQMETVHRHLPVVLAANVLAAALVVFVLWGHVASAWLVAWCLLIYVVSAVRIASVWRFWKGGGAARDHVDRWERTFFIGTLLSGGAWGLAGGLLYVPGSIEHQAFLAVVLVGMGAGAMASLSTYLPAFYVYFTLLLAPLVVRLFLGPDLVHEVLGAMGVLFGFIFSVFARNINRTLLESLKLRYENIELVEHLIRQKEAAERANIAKSKFMAAASHDLRQPLHALSLFSTALGERIRYPEVRKIVDNIGASVYALESLFNAMLDISRLDSGVLEPEIEDFRLQTLFDRLENDYQPQAAEKGLGLHVGTCGAVVVRSDKMLLERLLRNLLTNAIRYTAQGEITVSCRTLAQRLRIEVRDTGVGIPGEHIDDIFDEYVQLDNPERNRNKGLGLGLAIVSRIASLLRHPIYVDSSVGEGSLFAVDVPLGDPNQLREPRELPVQGPAQELEGLFVVVIDDEQAIRDAVQVLLEGWGCDVLAVASLDEAREQLRSQGRIPDGILADYRLGRGINGVEVIQELERMAGHSIPSILITGDTAAERLRDVHASGYRVLHKPVKPARMRAFLKYVHRLKQEQTAGVEPN